MGTFDLKPAPETVHEAEAYGHTDQWSAACKCGWVAPEGTAPARTYGAAIHRALRLHLDHIPLRDHYVSEG